MKIFNVQNPQLFFINFVFSEKIIFKIISTFLFILSGIAPPYPISPHNTGCNYGVNFFTQHRLWCRVSALFKITLSTPGSLQERIPGNRSSELHLPPIVRGLSEGFQSPVDAHGDWSWSTASCACGLDQLNSSLPQPTEPRRRRGDSAISPILPPFYRLIRMTQRMQLRRT